MGIAKEWWQIIKVNITQYAGFKKILIKKYWSYDDQQKIRDQLEHKKYNPKCFLSKQEYFCRMFKKANNLDPPISKNLLISM